MRFLLVHSPLVGPATLRPLARELRSRSHRAVVPDLTGIAHHPTPQWLLDRLRPDGRRQDVVVAHSGAGAILPAVAASHAASLAIFLDAVLPEPGAHEHVAPPTQLALLDQQVDEDGTLRPWCEWWPEDVMEDLVPDRQQRARIARECPRVPLALYRHAVPLPPRWRPSAYLALGSAYAEECSRARQLGWSTRVLPLSHLAPATHPITVASAILDLVSARSAG